MIQEPGHSVPPAPQMTDYSAVLLRGVIALGVVLPIALGGALFSLGYVPGALEDLLIFGPLFGLAVLTLLIGVLLLSWPLRVHNLVQRSRFPHVSSPGEASVWWFWRSALFWYIILAMLGPSPPVPSWINGFLAPTILVLFPYVFDVILRSFRRR